MADPCVCGRQRAGPVGKALVTDNYGYLRRYGPGAVRGRCGPALSRTTVDKLELRLALFGYDGIFYTLTFDDDHLPPDRAGVDRIWDAFAKRLRRWQRGPVDYYVYRVEGLHGDHRLHIHVFLRDRDFPPAVVQYLWAMPTMCAGTGRGCCQRAATVGWRSILPRRFRRWGATRGAAHGR